MSVQTNGEHDRGRLGTETRDRGICQTGGGIITQDYVTDCGSEMYGEVVNRTNEANRVELEQS